MIFNSHWSGSQPSGNHGWESAPPRPLSDHGSQPEKGGMPSLGWEWDPSPSGGVQVSWGLVHKWGTNGAGEWHNGWMDRHVNHLFLIMVDTFCIKMKSLVYVGFFCRLNICFLCVSFFINLAQQWRGLKKSFKKNWVCQSIIMDINYFNSGMFWKKSAVLHLHFCFFFFAEGVHHCI